MPIVEPEQTKELRARELGAGASFWLTVVDSSIMVDLGSRLSNPSTKDKLAETSDLVEAPLSRPQPPGDTCNSALCGERQVRIRDRVDIAELARRFANGATIKELAAGFSVSESSVKRLLRQRGEK